MMPLAISPFPSRPATPSAMISPVVSTTVQRNVSSGGSPRTSASMERLRLSGGRFAPEGSAARTATSFTSTASPPRNCLTARLPPTASSATDAAIAQRGGENRRPASCGRSSGASSAASGSISARPAAPRMASMKLSSSSTRFRQSSQNSRCSSTASRLTPESLWNRKSSTSCSERQCSGDLRVKRPSC